MTTATKTKMDARTRQAARRELVLKFVELQEALGELLLDVEEAALAGIISPEEEGLAHRAIDSAADELDSARPMLTGVAVAG